MQKLTYINLNNEQAVFCGAPYVLARLGGLGLPELEMDSIRGAYQQGETAVGCRRQRRMLTLTLHIMADSRAELYRLRMELLKILSPDKAVQDTQRAMLIYENDNGRYLTWAIPDGGLDAGVRMLDTQPNVKLSFRCESPYWYAVNPTSVAFENAGEGFSLPFGLPVDFGRRDYYRDADNAGQVSVPVEITIRCKGEIPRLRNRTTGREIALSAAVPEGNTLILNTDPARLDARIIDAVGKETGAFGKLSLGTPLADFTLRPGLNELQYEAGGASAQSEIRVTWRNAYEGVQPMMTLQLLNFAFEKLGELAQFESLQLTRSYFGTGSFSLTMDPRAPGAGALAPGVVALLDERRVFIIEDVQTLSRGMLTVKGCMLKGLAKRRVCVPPLAAAARAYQDFGWDRFTGSAEAAYLHYADNNLISPEDAGRAIPGLVKGENLDRGAVLPWQARFDRLDTLFQSIGEGTGLGWDIRADVEHKRFIFTAWQGTDRTTGETLCLISEKSGNAADVTYKQIRSGSATTLYAGGAGEDEERFILCAGGDAQGMARRESWAEAGSLEDAGLLALYARIKLGELDVKTTISAALIDSGACRYGRDYDVGDTVLIAGRFGSAAVRIAEITETYENGARSLAASFGDAPVTVGALLGQLKQAAR